MYLSHIDVCLPLFIPPFPLKINLKNSTSLSCMGQGQRKLGRVFQLSKLESSFLLVVKMPWLSQEAPSARRG